MAATVSASDSGNEPLATCPLCGDYEGAPASCESHISAKTDDLHQGEVGRAWRDEIEASVGAVGDVVGDLLPDEEEGAGDQEEATGGVAVGEVEGSEEGVGDQPEATEVLETEPVDEGEADPLGLPLPELDTSTMLILLALLFAATILYLRISNSGGQEEPEPVEEETEPSGQEEMAGGLISE